MTFLGVIWTGGGTWCLVCQVCSVNVLNSCGTGLCKVLVSPHGSLSHHVLTNYSIQLDTT